MESIDKDVITPMAINELFMGSSSVGFGWWDAGLVTQWCQRIGFAAVAREGSFRRLHAARPLSGDAHSDLILIVHGVGAISPHRDAAHVSRVAVAPALRRRRHEPHGDSRAFDHEQL